MAPSLQAERRPCFSNSLSKRRKWQQKLGLEETRVAIHEINITLSSKNVKNLEKVCTELVYGATHENHYQELAEAPECGSKFINSKASNGDGLWDITSSLRKPKVKKKASDDISAVIQQDLAELQCRVAR
ncbi:unnamed protein product [Dovyalis caffra]|uniref:Uncharacterized protein n=1 Tax=Dovyalis caffra TaxID=77055 RepID=A0AAV1SLJ6_9ROSI|nr:unnamed protein product [Dovyalis caffra]